MTCVWEPDPACLGDAWDDLDEEVQERALMLATSSLQTLTYGRVGACPITVRPCPEPRRCHCAWDPHLGSDGLWRNSCAHGSPCGPTSEITLPGPVGEIYALVIDGVGVAQKAGWDETGWDDIVWDPQYQWSDFRLDDGVRLVWQGAGPSPFMGTQDLNKPLSEPGTWGVIYSRSYPVAADGRIAVAYLAMEYAKACAPKGKCSLPRGVTSVVRNGVSFTVEAGLFPNGLTGIEIVDQFILKWAPAEGPTRNAVVFDPGSIRTRARVSSSVPSQGPFGSV